METAPFPLAGRSSRIRSPRSARPQAVLALVALLGLAAGQTASAVTSITAFGNFGFEESNSLCLWDGFLSCGELSGEQAADVAIGLIDGDANYDLVFALADDQRNRVCLGDGTGGFLCSDVSTDTNWTDAVALGDVNGDSHVDAIFGNSGDPNRVCLGDGTGSFSCSNISADTYHSEDLDLGDVNGDTFLDAVFANNLFPGQPVRVCLGDGLGGFTCSDLTADDPYAGGVALGHVDGDPHLDAVLALFDAPNRVCLGDGAGGFACSDMNPDVEFTWDVEVGDLDGDSNLDAVFSNFYGQPARLCLGDGSGGFSCSDIITGLHFFADLAIGRVNGDGFLDVVFAEVSDSRGNVLCLGDGAGGLGCADIADFHDTQAVAIGRLVTACGDGVVEPPVEECDDGNVSNGDTCSASCQLGPGVPVELPDSPTIVFDWTTDRCETEDFPDFPARAFRDIDGQVNLTAPHWTNYRMVGPSLDNVARVCTPIMTSTEDIDYGDFKYHEWISSPYTLDGQTVHALVHNEWYANLVDPTCDPNPRYGWVSAITSVVSTDKGASYTTPASYKVWTPPVPWDPSFTCSETEPTKYGAFSTSSIVQHSNGYFYSLFESNPDPNDVLNQGICIMRTADLSDATAWEIWSTARRWDDSESAVCLPLGKLRGTMRRSLSFNDYLGAYVTTGKSGVPTPGVFYSTSFDLFNWSEPVQIFEADDFEAAYPSLLDPADTSLNFEVSGQEPFLFYRVYNNPPGSDRDLVRRTVRFTADAVPPPNPPVCCFPSPCCGDGQLDPGEQCDDGNHVPGDCCSPTCTVETGPGAPPCCDANGDCRTGESCGATCFTDSICRKTGSTCECEADPSACPMTSGAYTFTSSSGTLDVGCFLASPDMGLTVALDVAPPGPGCVHEVVVPPAGFSSPAVCVDGGAYTTRIHQTGCGVGRIDSDGGADYTVIELGDTSDSGFCVSHALCTTRDDSVITRIQIGDLSPDSCTGSGTANALISIPARTETWQSPDWFVECPDCDGGYQPYPHCGCATDTPGAECLFPGGTDPACGGDEECKVADALVSSFPMAVDLSTDSATAEFVDLEFFGPGSGDGCIKGSGLGCFGPFTEGGASNACIDTATGATTLHAAWPTGSAGPGWPDADSLWGVTVSGTLAPSGPISGELCETWTIAFDGDTVDRCLIAP